MTIRFLPVGKEKDQHNHSLLSESRPEPLIKANASDEQWEALKLLFQLYGFDPVHQALRSQEGEQKDPSIKTQRKPRDSKKQQEENDGMQQKRIKSRTSHYRPFQGFVAALDEGSSAINAIFSNPAAVIVPMTCKMIP